MTNSHEQIVRMPLAQTAAWFAADANRLRARVRARGGRAPAGEVVDAQARQVLDLLLAELPVKGGAACRRDHQGAARKALRARARAQRARFAAGVTHARPRRPCAHRRSAYNRRVTRNAPMQSITLIRPTTGTCMCATTPRSTRWCRTPPPASAGR